MPSLTAQASQRGAQALPAQSLAMAAAPGLVHSSHALVNWWSTVDPANTSHNPLPTAHLMLSSTARMVTRSMTRTTHMALRTTHMALLPSMAHARASGLVPCSRHAAASAVHMLRLAPVRSGISAAARSQFAWVASLARALLLPLGARARICWLWTESDLAVCMPCCRIGFDVMAGCVLLQWHPAHHSPVLDSLHKLQPNLLQTCQVLDLKSL